MASGNRERAFMLVTFDGADHILEPHHQTLCGEEVPMHAHSTQKAREISDIDRDVVCPDCFKEARIDG